MVFIFAFFTATAYADDAYTSLSTLLNNVQSMQANFTQTIYDNRGKAIQKSFGNMSMQRPGKFRWVVTKPIPQVIVANASKLWIYDPDLEQVTIRSLKKSAGETPALLLSHVDTVLEKHYTVKQMQNNTAQGEWFSLTPKADSTFAGIKMGFIKGQIQEMDLEDHLGHTTRIYFKNIRTNINLSPSLFVFKANANTDVINETR
jgi:outer membrane lipoprotein carrier protein